MPYSGRTIHSNTRPSLHCSGSFGAMPADIPAIPRILNRTYLLPGFFSARTTTCRSPSFTAMPSPVPSPAPASCSRFRFRLVARRDRVGDRFDGVLRSAAEHEYPSVGASRRNRSAPILPGRTDCTHGNIPTSRSSHALASKNTGLPYELGSESRPNTGLPQNISPGIDIFCIRTRSSHPKGTFFPLRHRFKEDEAGSRKPPRPRVLSSAANMLRPLTHGSPPGRPGAR